MKFHNNFIALTIVFAVLIPTTVSADPITFAPIGDSITGGGHGIPGGHYRQILQTQLTADGVEFEFVGPHTDYDSGGWDQSYYGAGGSDIAGISADVAPSVLANQPDFALVLAGTNNHFNAPVLSEFEARYEEFITMIRTNSPGTSIIMSTVPKFAEWSDSAANKPFYWTTEFIEQRNTVVFPTMNQAIRNVAARYDNVNVVDLYSVIDITTDYDTSRDGVHPNLFGQQKLANLFHGEVSRQLNLPTQSVPEPSSFALLAILGGSLTLIRRKKSCRSASR